jgi:hypothetical protein
MYYVIRSVVVYCGFRLTVVYCAEAVDGIPMD